MKTFFKNDCDLVIFFKKPLHFCSFKWTQKKKKMFFNQNLDVLLDDCHLEPCLNGLIRLESLDWAIEKIEKGDYFEGQRKKCFWYFKNSFIGLWRPSIALHHPSFWAIEWTPRITWKTRRDPIWWFFSRFQLQLNKSPMNLSKINLESLKQTATILGEFIQKADSVWFNSVARVSWSPSLPGAYNVKRPPLFLFFWSWSNTRTQASINPWNLLNNKKTNGFLFSLNLIKNWMLGKKRAIWIVWKKQKTQRKCCKDQLIIQSISIMKSIGFKRKAKNGNKFFTKTEIFKKTTYLGSIFGKSFFFWATAEFFV